MRFGHYYLCNAENWEMRCDRLLYLSRSDFRFTICVVFVKGIFESDRLCSHCQVRSRFIRYCGVCCNWGRSSAKIAPSTGHTWMQMPQSIQVAKSIQYQSVPLTFLPGPSWIQATGQASTQSAMPSQVFVTIVCGTVFSSFELSNPIGLGLILLAYQARSKTRII